MIIANGFQPLTIITKLSILDVAAALDPHLIFLYLIYEQLSTYINLCAKKQHFFLLLVFNDDLYSNLYISNQIEFDLKSINQEFFLFPK